MDPEAGKPAVQVEQDEFATAFADLASNLREPGASTKEPTAEEKAAADKAAADAAAAVAAAQTPEEKAAAEKAAADKATADAAAALAAQTPEEKAAAEKAAADQAAADAAAAEKAAAGTAIAQIAETQKQIADTLTQLAPKPDKAAAAPEPALYTPEEDAALKKYVADWDQVHQGEALIRRAEYRQLVTHIFAEVQKAYAPLLEYVEQRSPRDQLTDIVALVPDYRTVRDPCVQWVATQPSIHKSAYERVIKDGSAEEVKELIDIWRQATGTKAPVTTTTTTAPASATATTPAAANDPKAAAALAALRPVETARTEQKGAADPNNFEDAFKEFAQSAA